MYFNIINYVLQHNLEDEGWTLPKFYESGAIQGLGAKKVVETKLPWLIKA